MGERPSGMTLDRISVMGHYTKNNCRWATDRDQANNKRKTETLYYDFDNFGPEGSPAEWARFLRQISGNPLWTVRNLRTVLKLMTLEQLVAAIHPQGLSPAELTARVRRANRTAAQTRVDKIFDDLKLGIP